ncbi:hypothetical protein PILCRDRAFT_9217 [Piloderma croceum F 1598]|uniref:Rab-GAP TBC domain-containing protein n=1 Tax=Piloderma croceum (strain F 1598) TaxID=765440 RepID=A0A0C3F7Z2_PILCF|nr:hypothetical protein PILCRDRAFT_9217 [Piloderma croceum F 1598]
MAERHTRPAIDSIKDAYNHLLRAGLSQAKIKDAAIGGRLFSSSDANVGTAGRSIAWKLFLLSDEPLQMPPETPSKIPLATLRASRKNFAETLLQTMRAPDGSYEEGFVVPGSTTSPKSERMAANLEKNNPLSLDDENPWKEWFATVELRKTILQDVERTFPDIGYFRDVDVQYQLTNILYLYSVSVPAIGYRQGMHELLAPLFYAVDYDSISDNINLDDWELKEMCSRTWVAADAWALFLHVMHGVSRWYEWRESEDETGAAKFSALANHVQFNPDGKVDLKPYVAPIVQACNHLQGSLLRSVDPLLWKKLQATGIEPQIYGIRWLRLLFTREFSMQDAMILWDGLFACDPTFEIVQWICVAMLLRIRNKLIPSDYSSQLTYLLRYPSPPPLTAPDLPHHATLLLRQAVALQMSPSPSAGASIVVENRNLLGIPVEVPDPPPAPARRRARPGERSHQISASDGSGVDPSGGRSGLPRQSSHQMGLPESIARGLLDRGESMGINKTFLTAVSELRRNLPDLTASLGRTTPPMHSASYATFPLANERPSEERPPWEPRTRFEMERDISEMRSLNKQLGKSVGWIVDALLQDEDEVKDAERLKSIQSKKREALESLAYVRDVLNGGVTKVEEERLWSEQKFERISRETRHSRNSGSFERSNRPQINKPQPVAPIPLHAGESRPQDAVDFPSSQMVSSSLPREPSPFSHPRSSLTASPPVRRSLHSPSASFSSPSQVLASGPGPSGSLAPWHSTPSGFSVAAPAVAPALPRIPPPTSTTYRPPRISSGQVDPSSPSHVSGNGSPRLEVHHDPLGAL